jgi:restriction endonuclease Mrr
VRHLKLIGKISLSQDDVRRTLSVFGSALAENPSTSVDATIDRLSGTDFERLVLALMKAMGFRAEMTKATGDGGIDVEAVLEGDSLLKGRYIVQCKRFGASRLVGVKIVREFYGVLNAAPEAVKGILITNTGFTGQAREFAKGTRLELVDGAQLHALLSKHDIRPA